MGRGRLAEDREQQRQGRQVRAEGGARLLLWRPSAGVKHYSGESGVTMIVVT